MMSTILLLFVHFSNLLMIICFCFNLSFTCSWSKTLQNSPIITDAMHEGRRKMSASFFSARRNKHIDWNFYFVFIRVCERPNMINEQTNDQLTDDQLNFNLLLNLWSITCIADASFYAQHLFFYGMNVEKHISSAVWTPMPANELADCRRDLLVARRFL